jgi:hypothetical protein
MLQCAECGAINCMFFAHDILTWVTWSGILHRPAGPAQRMSVMSSSFLLHSVLLLVRHLGGYGLVIPGFAGLSF